MDTEQKPALLALTADIVSAFVAKNAVRANELPEVIAAVHSALENVGHPTPAVEVAPASTPAVSIKKSVTDDYIICLDDGKRFRSLKRHLGTLGMTPDDYRAKWGLPRDYPMVAPGSAAKRSELAKAAGLGVGRRKAEAPAADVAPEPANDALVAFPTKRRAGRPMKAA